MPYHNRLAGKVAIITGAGSQGEGIGIGKAISIIFAGEGARVCLVDTHADRAEATRILIAEAGGKAFVCIGDVTHSDDCERFVRETVDRFGTVDVLVNNVGIVGAVGLLDEIDLTDWERVFQINVKSALLMARHTIPIMQRNGGGAIVNVSSTAGIRAHGSLAYGPSKAALRHLTDELAVMYGKDNIRANAVIPGHIHTPMTDELLPQEMRKMRQKVSPLGIEGEGWDVAHAALFLASNEARFITAQHITVDGGVTAMGAMTTVQLVDS